MKNLVVTEEFWRKGSMYTAYCPELNVASCGRHVEETRQKLLEVIKFQLDETAKLGTLKAFLQVAGYDLETTKPTLQLDKHVVAFNQRTVPLGGSLMLKLSPTDWQTQFLVGWVEPKA